MNQIRRVVALLLVSIATPSLFWVCYFPVSNIPDWDSADALFGWFRELLFVVCFAATAIAVWFGVRYWPSILLFIVGFQTYATAGGFIGQILIEPSRWSYFKLVYREAEGRGFSGGPQLVWSLIVLPVGLPVLFVVALWLFLTNHRAGRGSDI